MWHKNDGKPSPEVPQPPVGGTTKSQVLQPETPAALTVAPAPIAPTPAPRVTIPEPVVAGAPAVNGASRIQAGLKIHGEISGNSDLYIDGELQGKIRLGGARVVIGPNGKVQADIDAGAVIIEGSVQGNIKASESVRLGAGSRVQGSVVTPRIGIDDGARLRGKVEMVKAGSTPSASTAAAAVARATETEAPRPIAASAKAE
ncbi:MAG: polymer-forming cytoskeletal protein [Candidatus Acidiferrales bacterium]